MRLPPLATQAYMSHFHPPFSSYASLNLPPQAPETDSSVRLPPLTVVAPTSLPYSSLLNSKSQFSLFTATPIKRCHQRWRKLNDYLALIAKLALSLEPMEPMPLLGCTRPRSPQQGVSRLQKHIVLNLQVSGTFHHVLPTNQPLHSPLPGHSPS